MLEADPWTVLRVQTGKELDARDLLGRQEVEAYVPQGLLKVGRHAKIANAPLFAGYIFARYEIGRTLELVASIPYLYEAVRFGGRYALVEDEEILRVRALSEAYQDTLGVFAKLAKGTPVEVTAGSMTGCRGIFVSTSGADFICCNVTLFSRTVAARIPRQWVAPINTSASAGDKRQVDVTTLRRSASM